jgi:hypothetical protein
MAVEVAEAEAVARKETETVDASVSLAELASLESFT